ncbi:hypothetical protein HM1_3034 [Heliomicrobium modesticaldum Ice1]|uniref:Uncharacterized protein n=1 Tax=Heliobacterium modesticaldum (strain ATCC 51547 / Ice1) TaxID=498761 RepID=B0TDL6_HELMI|nr:hypothetical protein [Heliomicrobium modesticaldum]ABZ85541.1 hypothetical protein HM1_3034 [Heliomicrobium modesticaldum Ice1]
MALERTFTPTNRPCPIHPSFVHPGLSSHFSSHCLSLEACNRCDPQQCVVGLIRNMSEQVMLESRRNRVKKASQGERRSFSRQEAVELLALFLVRCRHCGKGHEEECELNLARLGLEYALTGHGDLFSYQGNPVLFLLNLRKSDPALADEVVCEYDRLRRISDVR